MTTVGRAESCNDGAGEAVEGFEVDGDWWIPSTPDRKVRGRLTVSEQGKGQLALVGSLRSFLEAGETATENGVATTRFTDRSMDQSGVYPRIVGYADNRSFTLEDCLQLHLSLGLGTTESERIRVSQAYRNVEFGAGEALEFQKAYVWMDWLAFWVMRSGLEESIEWTKAEDGRDKHSATTLRITPIEPESCAGQEDATVTLGQSYGIAGNRVTERRLTQDFYFSITMPGIVDLDVLLGQVSDLQNLVSIGTGKTAAYTALQFRHPDVVRSFGDSTQEIDIDMFATWQVTNDEEPKDLGHHQMFFSLRDLGDMDGVERWLAVAERNRSVLGRVMATRYARGMYLSDRVLNCAAALEAYDRSKNPQDAHYAERLRRSAALAGDPFTDLVSNVEAWVQALKDARNDVAHHNARMATESTEHLFLSRSAYWLFIFCLLREADAPDAVFEHIAEHSSYRWLERRLGEVLPPA